jgi:hypothetical protein
LGAKLLGVFAQQGFQALLRHEKAPAGAVLLNAGVQVCNVLRYFVSGQRFNRANSAVGVELLFRCTTNGVFQANGAKGFQRTQMEMTGARMNSGALMALDSKTLYAVMREHGSGG